MADTKITGYGALASPDDADLIEVVDVSDTSMAPTGTNTKFTLSALRTFLGPTKYWQSTGTLASGASVTVTHDADASFHRRPSFAVGMPSDGTRLLLHGNGVDASTTFTDSSAVPLTVTGNGNVQLDTAQFKYGVSSILCDGSGDYLAVTDSSLALPTDFTLEFWYRPTSSFGSVRVQADSRSGSDNDTLGFAIGTDGTGILFVYCNGYQISGSTLSLDTWYHIALTRTGSSIKLWLNGTQDGSTWTSATSFTRTAWRIGGAWNSTLYSNGWFDDIRLNATTGLYTGSFTAPVAELADPVLIQTPTILTTSLITGQASDRVHVRYDDGAGANPTTKTTFTNLLGRSVTYTARVYIPTVIAG